MSLPEHQIPENRGIDWLAVARTLLIQVAVLLALGGAFIGYVNWSSEQAVWEFINAGETNAPATYRTQSSVPLQAVKGQATCKRKN